MKKALFIIILMPVVVFYAGYRSAASAGRPAPLDYVSGAFIMAKSDTSDNNVAVKHKFPYVSNGYLMFLKISEKGAESNLQNSDIEHQVYALALSDVLPRNEANLKPISDKALIYPSPGGQSSVSVEKKGYQSTISAFFEGPSFLELKRDGTQFFLAAGRTEKKLIDESIFINCAVIRKDQFLTDGENIHHIKNRHTVPVFKKGFFKGIIYYFDYNGKWFAVEHKNRNGMPDVCLARKGDDSCIGLPDKASEKITGIHEPKFSEDGRYLAVSVALASQSWNIHVYEISDNGSAEKIDSINRIHRYNTTVDKGFRYFGSFNWRGSTLYYMQYPGHAGLYPKLNRKTYDEKKMVEHALLTPPSCIKVKETDRDNAFMWHPLINAWCESSSDDPCSTKEGRQKAYGQVEIIKIIWAYPFVYENVRYIAAQTLVNSNVCYFTDQSLDTMPRVLSRIIIFKDN